MNHTSTGRRDIVVVGLLALMLICLSATCVGRLLAGQPLISVIRAALGPTPHPARQIASQLTERAPSLRPSLRWGVSREFGAVAVTPVEAWLSSQYASRDGTTIRVHEQSALLYVRVQATNNGTSQVTAELFFSLYSPPELIESVEMQGLPQQSLPLLRWTALPPAESADTWVIFLLPDQTVDYPAYLVARDPNSPELITAWSLPKGLPVRP